MAEALHYRQARQTDAAECIALRARTRENAISTKELAEIAITEENWGNAIGARQTDGFVCVTSSSAMVGYCFANPSTGEIQVLAVLPNHEGKGIGRALLTAVTTQLHQAGHTRLYLACSPDPEVRSYNFYRRLGWQSTNEFEPNGDEILELHVQPSQDGGA